MAVVFIGLGTNIGHREMNLESALKLLEPKVHVTARSPIYETEPWGFKDQPSFLNMAVSGNSELEPEALMHWLKGIERSMGRTPGIRYGPRVIDLDLLFFDDQAIHSRDLIVPHPRLAERRFVLVPLADIAPDWVHPVLRQTVKALLSQLPDDGSVKAYSPPNQ